MDKIDLDNHKKELPIFHKKDIILDAVKNNEVILITGDTGCGKSTQIPQYLFNMHIDYKIGITQPRKIAAISLAQRVSKELNSTLGETVGYEVRFENKQSIKTKILFMTEGILLRKMLCEKFIKEFSILIIDEAHERSLNCDIAL